MDPKLIIERINSRKRLSKNGMNSIIAALVGISFSERPRLRKRASRFKVLQELEKVFIVVNNSIIPA